MMRTRITAVSLGKGASMGKIGITCRQPFLGADEWIEEEIKNGNKPKPVAKVRRKNRWYARWHAENGITSVKNCPACNPLVQTAVLFWSWKIQQWRYDFS